MTIVAILTAAGSGRRLGHAVPKALVELVGVSLVMRSARALVSARAGDDCGPDCSAGRSEAPVDSPDRSGLVGLVVVTAPADQLEAFAAVLGGEVDGVRVLVVAGGPTRQASVAAGLAAVRVDAEVILVHVAARALVPPGLVARVVAAVRAGHAAVVPGLQVTDTIKRVDGAGAVVETLFRDGLRAVQTPQGFTSDVLTRAHAAGAHRSAVDGCAASDDAGLVEAIGEPVWVVDGHEDAFKITTRRDLALAGLVLAARERPHGDPPVQP